VMAAQFISSARPGELQASCSMHQRDSAMFMIGASAAQRGSCKLACVDEVPAGARFSAAMALIAQLSRPDNL
jgi:hypothetical protein